MQKLQSQGVHHITICGADRQTSIDFWEGLLGMPFVFEQPNLDNEGESHLYFDPGDGRLITIFTDESRTPDPRRTPTDPGLRAPHRVLGLEGDVRPGGGAARRARDPSTAASRIAASWTRSTSTTRSGSRSSSPPTASSRRIGFTHAEVLLEAHKLRVARGDHHIAQAHLADAIEDLVLRSRASLSDDRSAKNPY